MNPESSAKTNLTSESKQDPHSKLPDVIPISSFRCRLENVTMRENLDKLD